MEKKNKNQISVFLMVVGVLFILVAGTIFVTTAWKQLPIIAKQVALLCVSLGLFAGAGKVGKGGKLQKTETALFYLGVAFAGFFTVSVLGQISGYVSETILLPKAFSLMTACLVMMIPTFLRFLKTRKGLDFAVIVILTDGVIVWSTIAFELSAEVFVFILAAVMLFFAMGDYCKEKWMNENEGLDMVFCVSYLLHGIAYVCLMWIEVFEKGAFFSLTVVLSVVTLLTYMGRKKAVYRVFNSLAIVWSVFTGVDFVNSILPEEIRMSIWGILFTVYVIILAITVYTLRMELVCISITFGVVVSFAQLISYGGYDVLFVYVPHEKTAYIPFTVGMMIAMTLVVKRWMEKGKITWDEDGKRLVKAIAIQALTVFILVQAAAMEGFITMGLHVLTMVLLLTLAMLKKKAGVGKGILYTFALGTGELALMNQPYFEIPKNYKEEWICFLLGIGIVLLHRIWYDKAKGMRVVSFVLTCILLAALLIRDMIQGGLGNVMILGVTGVIMLVVAAIFNRREYVIAASVTLILLVLYITRSFWLSIAWWVYLFVAGVVLVLLAIKKEKES